jgi:hypothetical protein
MAPPSALLLLLLLLPPAALCRPPCFGLRPARDRHGQRDGHLRLLALRPRLAHPQELLAHPALLLIRRAQARRLGPCSGGDVAARARLVARPHQQAVRGRAGPTPVGARPQ